MYKPLKTESPQILFCFFNATTALCWAISKPLPTESVDFFFLFLKKKKKKIFCLPEIFLMKKITKMNVLFKIIHAF